MAVRDNGRESCSDFGEEKAKLLGDDRIVPRAALMMENFIVNVKLFV